MDEVGNARQSATCSECDPKRVLSDVAKIVRSYSSPMSQSSRQIVPQMRSCDTEDSVTERGMHVRRTGSALSDDERRW